MQLVALNSLDNQLLFGIYYVNLQPLIAKILGKTHNPKVLGADTHSVSLMCNSGVCYKVNFLSYRYRVDKSTIFGMRGLWGLTIHSERGATLKYL